MAEVPAVDAEPGGESGPLADEQIRITNKLLAAEAKARESENREKDQRYLLRWAAFIIALAIIVGMSCLLWHVSHKLMSLRTFGAPSAYIIAVYVAPIVSVTTLAIALLVAAFRKFQDTDESDGMNTATESARASGIIN